MATAARSPLLSALVITLAAAVSCGTCPPAPSINSLSPSSTTAGGKQFLLSVNGHDFRRDSVVSWNNSFRMTTFTSSHELVTTITAGHSTAGTVLVFVFNPPEGGTTFVSGGIGLISTTACRGKTSNAVSFTINP